MQDRYEMLAQEPWCMDPDKFARLTDWQIENLYRKPAEKRAQEMREEMEKNRGGSKGNGTFDMSARESITTVRPSEEWTPDKPGFRQWLVATFCAAGVDNKTANQMYEDQMKQYLEEQELLKKNELERQEWRGG